MTSRLNPYISFAGNAREALEFYNGVLGGTLTLNTFGEFGATGRSGGRQDHARHAGDRRRPRADGRRHPARAWSTTPGDNIAVSLSGDDADDLRGYWEKLSDGAKVEVPLEKQMWGDEFGMCVDRFGITWMVNIAAPKM